MPVQFIKNPLPPTNPGERHIPAVLLVDISGSMSGKPIEELNRGLREFGIALQEDSLALGRAEVCVISFNSSVQTEMGFRPATEYEAPVLSAGGLTSFNEAIQVALDAIEARKEEYRGEGIQHYRPWLFVLTDGLPTDDNLESVAKDRIQNAIRNKKLTYMPMGIGAADTKKLQEYYPDEVAVKPVLKADSKNFKEAFVWLSNSIGVVSSSDPTTTDQVQLPPTPSMITVGI